jgi:hypothetical protein
MRLLFPFLLVMGLFLPGLFIAKYLRHNFVVPSAFLISLLVLFHSVFWLGIFGIAINLRTVLAVLTVVTCGMAWLDRRSKAPARQKDLRQPIGMWDWIIIAASGIEGGALLTRVAVSPLIGPDTQFRWDFLAQKLFALGKFDFYPPLKPADFHTYFYVDAIPPMVSFTHWWLYASAGRYSPSWICLFVAAQFVCTIAFTYGAAAAMFSRRAGWLAASVLAASPLYLGSVLWGQETGLTALSVAATLYFLASAPQQRDLRPMVAAGFAASLCALSREYGWIALLIGVIALVWQRRTLKQITVFTAVTTAVAAPWYARNWTLTGNPFYSLRLGGFTVNPVHDEILQHYQRILGVQHWTSIDWTNFARFLVASAPIPILVGVVGAVVRFRRHGYLGIAVLLLSAVWLGSVGYTSAGAGISTRVLTPALVVLSILAAGLAEPFTRSSKLYALAVSILVICQMWTAAHAVFYPGDAASVSPKLWRQAAFQKISPPAEFEMRDQLIRILPAGARVLSDNAYLHASLTDRGIEVVPVWSPEVRFIFSSSPDDADRRLRSLGITSVAYYPQSLNTGYLITASPFYRALPQRWHLAAAAPGFLNIFVP